MQRSSDKEAQSIKRKKTTTGHRSNLKQWSSLMKPIKFPVTSLIPRRHGSNQSVTQFRFWTDFWHGNEVACLCDQRSVLRAKLSTVSTCLFHPRYFENETLEPGYNTLKSQSHPLFLKVSMYLPLKILGLLFHTLLETRIQFLSYVKV